MLCLPQAGMWAQPPAVPPPAHYAPPTLPAPVPRDPMSFPPGIIPQLVRVRAALSNPAFNPRPQDFALNQPTAQQHACQNL